MKYCIGLCILKICIFVYRKYKKKMSAYFIYICRNVSTAATDCTVTV